MIDIHFVSSAGRGAFSKQLVWSFILCLLLVRCPNHLFQVIAIVLVFGALFQQPVLCHVFSARARGIPIRSSRAVSGRNRRAPLGNVRMGLFLNSLNALRNTHAHILQSQLPSPMFQQNVIVLGSRGIDELAAVRTPGVLFWAEIRQSVETYDKLFICLRRCAPRGERRGE